ncbi:MAG TPA: CinA family nicotinamide mononucleotide deamidase-related protein [Granulicella sp.]
MIAEIIAAGSEMLTPHRQDTNSLYLTERLNALGVAVAFKTIVGDNPQHLTDAARIALHRADIVILSGGLGPTEDDLTREAVAAALGLGLHRDADVLAAMYQRFATRGLTMPENNSKQADVLDGANILANKNGSAPGQWLDTVVDGHRKIVILLPGPPREIMPLFTDVCEPLLAATLPERHFAKRMLRIALMPESKVDAIAAPIYQTYTDVESTILSSGAEIQLHFLCIKPTLAEAQQRVDQLTSQVEDALDEAVFSAHSEALEEIVLLRLQMRGLTLATAESITGGMVATRLTSIAGASDTYVGGAVVYSPHLKKKFASVPDDILKNFGTVSEEAARALAEGIRKEAGVSIGLAVTGVAGPGPMMDTDDVEKPCGLVYVAVSDGISTESLKKVFAGDRERIRAYAAQQALDILRHKLI